ncbi:DUF4411 family protein [Flavobacterium sp. HXWNR69]|uniref:DUF4411 family protein n=1 Tax=Flavobacterium fragile TaxID=2949085 RepID=A0ABT0TIW5_9FLAO|nr:DUF4411 family protein [Flavobacterium sp. HXWNR69]MCL9770914.1 DUF4411 family protein [Flavobacterium sp. HXWNR69]
MKTPKKKTAENFIKDIRRNTRRIFSSEQKIQIVMEALRAEMSVAELCRKYSINESQFYKWNKEFLEADEADAWLIAFAMTYGNQIVTHEVSKPNSKSRVMVPDAANPFNVICIKTVDLFRALGVKI